MRALDLLEWVMPYEILFTFVRKRPERFAFYYVAGYLAMLVTILATSSLWIGLGGWIWVLMIVPAARLVDVFRWWADFLFDRRHSNLVSAERSLFFAIVNLGEVALIAAIWLRATGQAATPGEALFMAFSLVTQLSLPPHATAWAKVAVALTEITALLLLLGGIASLIALVPKKVEAGEHKSYSKWRAFFAARRAQA